MIDETKQAVGYIRHTDIVNVFSIFINKRTHIEMQMRGRSCGPLRTLLASLVVSRHSLAVGLRRTNIRSKCQSTTNAF